MISLHRADDQTRRRRRDRIGAATRGAILALLCIPPLAACQVTGSSAPNGDRPADSYIGAPGNFAP